MHPRHDFFCQDDSTITRLSQLMRMPVIDKESREKEDDALPEMANPDANNRYINMHRGDRPKKNRHIPADLIITEPVEPELQFNPAADVPSQPLVHQRPAVHRRLRSNSQDHQQVYHLPAFQIIEPANEILEQKFEYAVFNYETSYVRPHARLSMSWSINIQDLVLGKKIGEGSFGDVYQGIYQDYSAAIKRLKPEKMNDLMIEEFKNEATVMQRCNSPHLVRFYGYHFAHPNYSLVMEYMPNGSLTDVLSNKKIPIDPFVMIRSLAYGVAHLHDNNIVHRDIKSLNIFVDSNMKIKLGDYGMARMTMHALHDSLEKSDNASARGTVAWMAPELWDRNSKYTFKSDIFAMGVTILEIVTRQMPYYDYRVINNAAIKQRTLDNKRPTIPASCQPLIKNIIEQCWDQNPLCRPTARAVSMLFKPEKKAQKAVPRSFPTATPKPNRIKPIPATPQASPMKPKLNTPQASPVRPKLATPRATPSLFKPAIPKASPSTSKPTTPARRLW